MSNSRLVITAIEVEGRTPAEVVAEYGISRSWLFELLAWYRTEGDAAFEPRSRRPLTSPHATPVATVELVLRLREQLAEAGLDAGADTIGWHLTHRHQLTVSRATGSPAAAAAATTSSSSCTGYTSSRRTPDPTTPPPAGKSRGSNRP